MFKLSLIHKLTLLSIPVIGIAMTGCSTNGYYFDGYSRGYVYHDANGKMYYQDGHGRYYVMSKHGRCYYKKYYVNKDGYRYYRYYRYYPEGRNYYMHSSSLSTPVQTAINSDPMLKNQNINVKTNESTVALTGVVGTETQKRQAVAIVLGVPGVKYVDDNIQVKS